MTFGAPSWLWALALLPALALLFFANERRGKLLLQKIVAARLLPQLAGSVSPGKRRLRFFILSLGLASIIVSLAQPRIGYTWEQSKRRGRDVLIAIDTSKSMLATDAAPNRLTRAKLAAQDLIALLQGDRVGVLAFAGTAFLQAPLTIDYGAALDSIGDLDTDTIPRGGTDIAGVIEAAARAFGNGESEDRALVLFTDGEELEADGVAAARKYGKDFRIFTVGVGSAEGTIIPMPETNGGTGFVKDPATGQIVKSKLDETRLREIAAAADGFYTHLQNGPAEMKKIVQVGLGKMREHDIDARMARHPIERYQWPLALGLALIAGSMFIRERRRASGNANRRLAVHAALVLFALWPGPQSAKALSLNEGVNLYNDKKYKDAYDVFQKQIARNPDSQALEFDRGAAAYKMGEYDKAIDAFGRAIVSSKPDMRVKSEYNLGNALCLRGVKQETEDVKLKDWNNAIQHYNEALKIDPKNGEAKFNRDVVRKLIEELEKKPPESKQDKNQQQSKNENNSQNDQSQHGAKPGEKRESGQQKKDQSGSPQQNREQNSGNPNKSPENQSGQQNQQQQQQQPSQQSAPAPGGEEKKLSGQIHERQQTQKPDETQKGGARDEPYVPGQERAMTADEAQRVIEAEKDEEAKGVLIERKSSAPVLRDW